jgi:hypothetical protein
LAGLAFGHIYFAHGTYFDRISSPKVPNMSEPEHIDLLIRAFKAAWNHYFQPSRNTGVLECLARPALAVFLVRKVRQGVHDEPSLAAAGLEFLFSLEDEDDLQEEPVDFSLDDSSPENSVDEPDVWWNVHLENASARFLAVGHVRLPV